MKLSCRCPRLDALSFFFLTALALAILSSPANAADTSEPRAPLKIRRQARLHGVDVTVASGVARFQDLQVPFDLLSRSRIDGSPSKQDTGVHIGIPVVGRLDYIVPVGNLIYETGFEAVHVAGQMGPPETAGASYGRIALHAGIGHESSAIPGRPMVGFELLARRESLNNVSSGHTIQSYMGQVVARMLLSRRFLIKTAIGESLGAELGYNDGRKFASKPIPHSTAAVQSVSAEARYFLSPSASFVIGLEHSATQISVADTLAYNEVGLELRAPSAKSMAVSLATQALWLGLAKTF